MSGANRARRLQTVAAGASVVLLWASAFVVVKIALDELPPGPLALARYAVASLVFVPLVWYRGAPCPSPRDLVRLAVAGGVGISMYNVAFNAGQRTVSPGEASLVLNTGPIWTSLFAMAVLGERIDGRGWTGTVVSFFGVAVIALHNGGWSGVDPGVLLIVAAAVAQAVYFVIVKPLLARHHPIEVTAWAVWFGSVFLSPYAIETIQLASVTSSRTWAAVLFLGVGPAALAYVAWSYVLAALPAAQAANLLFLVPVAAIGIAWLGLGLLPSGVSLAGGTVAVFGVLIGRGLVFRRRSLVTTS